MYTSGQLAKHCRVSVRTVQYYDQQGLLHARRTTSNQRRYQEDDLRRLQRILAYRQLGFTIKDIRELLDQQDDQALRTAITLQEQRTQQELQAAQDRLTGLKYLRDQLVHTGNFPGNIAAHVKRSHAHRLTRLRVRTALGGLLIFRERLKPIGWAGMMVMALAVAMLTLRRRDPRGALTTRFLLAMGLVAALFLLRGLSCLFATKIEAARACQSSAGG